MNIQESSNSIKVVPEDITEVWFEKNNQPVLGVFTKNGIEYCFYAYTNISDSDDEFLYLYSYIPADVLELVREGRLEILSVFSHSSAMIDKEIIADANWQVKTIPVLFDDLEENELPDPHCYFMIHPHDR